MCVVKCGDALVSLFRHNVCLETVLYKELFCFVLRRVDCTSEVTATMNSLGLRVLSEINYEGIILVHWTQSVLQGCFGLSSVVEDRTFSYRTFGLRRRILLIVTFGKRTVI